MDEFINVGEGPMSRVCVYGLEESIRASKFPMAVDLDKLTTDMTGTAGKLAQAEPGSGHDQWLTGVICQFDLKFSLKAWTEFQRYHFADFVSSQSTMHRITRFSIWDQCNEYVNPYIKDAVQDIVDEYNKKENPSREDYLKVLYNIPTGFQLTARITTNYRQLKTIYSQRHDHRLPEWRQFCNQLKELPYFQMIVWPTP